MAHTPRMLPWIVAFKAFKAMALAALGVALLVTRHSNPAHLLTRLALALHLPQTSEWFARALALATDLTIGRRLALAVTAFGYACLMATEGIGLHLRKSWARWLTIIATASLVPLEVYEILRNAGPVRILVLLANVAIVIYLFRRKEDFES